MSANLWLECRVAAIAFVRQLAPGRMLDTGPLRVIIGLTPAEARLASALLQGTSLDEAAAQLGVTRNTIRTQLRGLFIKTDTHRQSDLLRVLLRLV